MKSKTIATLERYFHTLKYLKPIQVYGRIKMRLHRPRANLRPHPLKRHHIYPLTLPVLKPAHMLAPNKVVLLNQVMDISTKAVWSDVKLEKLWLYNLHYFDLLHSQFQNDHHHWQLDLIRRWIDENPPGKGSGWESYTLSLRIVNWIKWFLLGYPADPVSLHSLAVQVRYLYKRLEIHLLANHLLANAKALIFAGLFFAGPEAEKWLHKGLRLFNREISDQTLEDGGHFELSPMYHSIVLEDLLDCINLFRVYDKPVPQAWCHISEKMFYWLECMCHADQDIAFFNDSALGVAATLQELRDYQQRLQLKAQGAEPPKVRHLEHSGFCRIQHSGMLLIADVAEIGASYQPGHAHADTLSFELSIHGQRTFVNSGTSTYNESHERLRQRSTKAHNTLMVDDTNSSEVWKSFRVARRAEIMDVSLEEKADEVRLTASHNGYYHQHRIIHTRTWQLRDKKLMIRDQVKGHGSHKIQIMFYLHPQIKSRQQDECTIMLYHQGSEPLAVLRSDHALKLLSSSYHPQFNVSIQNKLILIEVQCVLPAEFNTELLCI